METTDHNSNQNRQRQDSQAQHNPRNTKDELENLPDEADLQDRDSQNQMTSGRQDDVSGRGYATDNVDEQRRDWNSDDMGRNNEDEDNQDKEADRDRWKTGQHDEKEGNDTLEREGNVNRDTKHADSDTYGSDSEHTADRI